MQDARLTFKEMCQRFDVTPRTLRYYEQIELLAPERHGRSRLYSPRDVARMTLVARGRRFDFGLEEIRQWLMLYDQGNSEEQHRVWLECSDRQLRILQRRRDDLDAVIAELRALMDATAARQPSELA